MQLQEIGIVHNAYKNLTDIPRQGRMGEAISEIEIHPDFADGLLKIEQNKHLIVLYWAHLAKRDILKTIPPRRQGASWCIRQPLPRSPESPLPLYG